MLFLAVALSKTVVSLGRLEVPTNFRNYTIEGSIFSNLRADGENAPRNSGGAVVISGVPFVVHNSTFSKCSAQFGGAIAVFNGRLFIEASTMTGNYADQIGGAIFSLASMIDIKSTTFVTNSAQETHGAISLLSSTGQSTISDCVFEYNSAGYSGGAVGVTQSDLIIKYTYFSKNLAGNLHIAPQAEDSYLGSSAPTGGALFYQVNTGSSFDLVLLAVTFEDNNCTSHQGKDIALYGQVKLSVPDSVCLSSIDNIFLTKNAHVSTVSNSSEVCYRPEETFEADIIRSKPEKFEFDLHYFADSGPGVNPKKLEIANMDAIVMKDDSTSSADHKVTYRTNVSITSSMFQGCRAISPNPSQTMGGALYCVQTKVVLVDAEFVSNTALVGGAISLVSSTLRYTSTTNGLSRVSYNTASDASAIYALYSQVTLNNLQVMSCTVNSTTGFGALVIDKSSATITDCTFQQNRRGAVSVRGFEVAPYTTRTVASLTGCCFYMNNGVSDLIAHDLTVTGYSIVHIISTYDTDISKGYSIRAVNQTSGSEIYFPVVNEGSASITYGTTSCRSSAPGYQDGTTSNPDTTSKTLPLSLIIGIAVGALALIVVLLLIIVLRRNGDVDSDDEDDYALTKTDDTFDDDTTNTYASSDLPSVTIKNGLCTVAARDTSDSLFDDFEVDID